MKKVFVITEFASDFEDKIGMEKAVTSTRQLAEDLVNEYTKKFKMLPYTEDEYYELMDDLSEYLDENPNEVDKDTYDILVDVFGCTFTEEEFNNMRAKYEFEAHEYYYTISEVEYYE